MRTRPTKACCRTSSTTTCQAGWPPGAASRVQTNYQLLSDNLLDLTHETYVRSKTIGNHAVVETPMTWKLQGNEVHVERVMRNTPPPPLFRRCNFPAILTAGRSSRFQMPAHISIDAHSGHRVG